MSENLLKRCEKFTAVYEHKEDESSSLDEALDALSKFRVVEIHEASDGADAPRERCTPLFRIKVESGAREIYLIGCREDLGGNDVEYSTYWYSVRGEQLLQIGQSDAKPTNDNATRSYKESRRNNWEPYSSLCAAVGVSSRESAGLLLLLLKFNTIWLQMALHHDSGNPFNLNCAKTPIEKNMRRCMAYEKTFVCQFEPIETDDK